MFSKLYVVLVLLLCYANLIVKGSPLVQGMSGTYSTHPLQENLPHGVENEVEDSEFNKIVKFSTLPLSTAETVTEKDGNLPITNSFELNQTSVTNLQEILETRNALQNRPKFEENINTFQSELLISTDDNKVLLNESLANVEAIAPIQLMPQYHIFSSKTSYAEDDSFNGNQMPLYHDSDSSFPQAVVVETSVTTPQSGPVNSFMNGYYSDYDDHANEHDMEGNMNDDGNDEDEDSLPLALKNLPHDIPPDRTIYEVLAENIVKDKKYDEFRIEELIHELMDHYDTHNGLGEVYAGETDYDEKARPENKDIPILERFVEASSTASPYK